MAATILTLTSLSCSLPSTQSRAPASSGKSNKVKTAKLSGVLQLQEGCAKGYYQVKLQGVAENANIQVESQTDVSGRFSLVAPAGTYIMQVTKDSCGSKEPLELLENTEHMLSVAVSEIKMIEKSDQNIGRIPASILVLPKK